jgi:hypothetical protein
VAHIYLYDVNPVGSGDPNAQQYIDETPTYSGAGTGIDQSPDGVCCNATAGSQTPGGGWSLFETHYNQWTVTSVTPTPAPTPSILPTIPPCLESSALKPAIVCS